MRSPPTVRTYVVGLIIVVVLPLLVFSAFLVRRSAQHEQEIIGGTVREASREAARDVERELSAMRGQLFLLVNAGDADQVDFAALYKRASAAFGNPDLEFVLSDPSGKERVNTTLPFGASLPEFADRRALQQVLATGQAYISDLTSGSLSHKPQVMLSVPVMQQGKTAYIASVDVLPAITRVMAQQQLPDGWIATVDDREGATITRSLDPQRFVGQMSRADFLQRIRHSDEGWFPGESREGIPLYVGYTHVSPVGWTVVFGIPIDALFAPVTHSTRILAAAGICSLAVALLLAALIGRRIARPIDALVSYAATAGRGEQVAPRLTGLRETDAVATTLRAASEQLRESRQEQEKAAEALRQSERSYRALANDLARANEERGQLLQRIVLAQEAERRRITRELHDSLAQYLTAVQLGLSRMEQISGADAQAQRQLAELKGLTTDIGDQLSRIAWELRPTILDDLGLQVAISRYLEEWAERCGLHFDLQFSLGDRRLPQMVETTLYRVLQEAVTNVVRHAEATRVGVILNANGNSTQMIVEDDGKGFCLDKLEAGDSVTRHLGMIGMRERLALLNGSMEVESAPGSGTTLFIRLPL